MERRFALGQSAQSQLLKTMHLLQSETHRPTLPSLATARRSSGSRLVIKVPTVQSTAGFCARLPRGEQHQPVPVTQHVFRVNHRQPLGTQPKRELIKKSLEAISPVLLSYREHRRKDFGLV